jgi:hypothetical protein
MRTYMCAQALSAITHAFCKIYIHTETHTYIHTYVHAHTHTCMHSLEFIPAFMTHTLVYTHLFTCNKTTVQLRHTLFSIHKPCTCAGTHIRACLHKNTCTHTTNTYSIIHTVHAYRPGKHMLNTHNSIYS